MKKSCFTKCKILQNKNYTNVLQTNINSLKLYISKKFQKFIRRNTEPD